MPRYEFRAIDRNGREIQDVVDAADARAAAQSLRKRGYTVRLIERASVPELERDCPGCGQEIDIESIRCSKCRHILRGRIVDQDPGELPPDYNVIPNADGTAMITRVGWRLWSGKLGCLGITGFFLGLFSFMATVLFWMFEAPAYIYHVFYTLTGIMALPFVIWFLFGWHEWIVAPGLLEDQGVLFGYRWGRQYRDGAFKIERRVVRGGPERRPASYYRVAVECLDRTEELFSERTAETARAVAAVLAHRTGWPLDNRVE